MEAPKNDTKLKRLITSSQTFFTYLTVHCYFQCWLIIFEQKLWEKGYSNVRMPNVLLLVARPEWNIMTTIVPSALSWLNITLSTPSLGWISFSSALMVKYCSLRNSRKKCYCTKYSGGPAHLPNQWQKGYCWQSSLPSSPPPLSSSSPSASRMNICTLVLSA